MELSKQRYLVIDDAMAMRKMVVKCLKELGAIHIEEANDGSVGWQKMQALAKTTPYDIVVCDWMMPQMQGIDLLKLVRKDPTYKEVVFLMVTAESEVVQIQQAIEEGVDNYLVKPFQLEQFKDKLTRAIAARKG